MKTGTDLKEKLAFVMSMMLIPDADSSTQNVDENCRGFFPVHWQFFCVCTLRDAEIGTEIC